MGLITIKVKVRLTPEELMENLQDRDLGTVDIKGSKWVWRERTMRESHIASITRYNSTKTLMERSDGSFVLIDEPFTEVDEKWKETYYEGFIDEEEEVDEEPLLNQDGEKDSEDD